MHMGNGSGNRSHDCGNRNLQLPLNRVRIERQRQTKFRGDLRGSNVAALGISSKSKDSHQPYACDYRDVSARQESLGGSLCDLSCQQREWKNRDGEKSLSESTRHAAAGNAISE